MDAHRFEVVDLFAGQDAQRRRDVDVHGLLDRGDGLPHLGHQLLVRATDSSHDAELGGAGRRGRDRGIDQAGDVQPGGAHGGGEQPGLRAEVAILGAAAGLDRDDAFHLHLRAAPAHAHAVGEVEELRDALVGQLQDG